MCRIIVYIVILLGFFPLYMKILQLIFISNKQINHLLSIRLDSHGSISFNLNVECHTWNILYFVFQNRYNQTQYVHMKVLNRQTRIFGFMQKILFRLLSTSLISLLIAQTNSDNILSLKLQCIVCILSLSLFSFF